MGSDTQRVRRGGVEPHLRVRWKRIRHEGCLRIHIGAHCKVARGLYEDRWARVEPMQFSPTFPGKGENKYWGFSPNDKKFSHIVLLCFGLRARERGERRIVGVSMNCLVFPGRGSNIGSNLKALPVGSRPGS